MRSNPIIAIAIAIAAVSTGCGSSGSRVFDISPELAPGATTWERWSKARSTPSDAEGTPTEATPLPADLDGMVRLVVARNARVRSAWHAWEAGIAGVDASGQLPDPTLSYTWLPAPVETRVGPNEHRIALSQAIPSIPALVADRDHARAKVDALRHGYQAAVLDAVTGLKSRLAEVRFLQRALESVDVNVALARQLAAASGERYGDDRGTLFDVTKARAQLAQLDYDRLRFEELLREAIARLNALLDRAPGAPVGSLAGWPTTALPDDVKGLYAAALRNEPGLLKLDAELEASMAGVRKARGGLFPDFMIGAQYMVNGPARMPGVADSGEDAVGLTIGLRLPLSFGLHSGRIASAEANLAKGVEDKRQHVSELLATIEHAYYRVRNAERLRHLYDTTLLPQARKAMADAEAWYREGVGGFTDFLEARATFYQFTLSRERALAERVQAEAALERAIGQPLRMGFAGTGSAAGGER